jgi:hypothetical protein
MSHLLKVTASTVIALLAVTANVGLTSAATGVRVGVLNCTVKGGVGLILGSRKTMNCTFKPSGGSAERYTGSVTKIGLDIGVTTKSYITWAVFAPGKLKAGSLAGGYGGGSAEATLGLGLGANVLVGGFKKSVALQPLSVQGQKGLNVAVGIAGMSLKYAGK